MFKGPSCASADSAELMSTSTAPRRSPQPNVIIQQGQGRNATLGKLNCTLALAEIAQDALEGAGGYSRKEKSPKHL